MKRRIFFALAGLAAFSILLTSLLVTAAAQRGFESNLRKEISAEAKYLHAGLSLYGADFLSRINLERGHRITLIEPDGQVRYDSRGKAEDMENHANRPEVVAALTSGEGMDLRVSSTLREQTYYFALQMDDGSVFRLAASSNSLLASFDRLFWLVCCIVVLGVALAFALSSLITRKIVHPLHSIDLDAPEEGGTYEELSPLLSRIMSQRAQIGLQTQELDRQRAQFDAITRNMDEGLLVLQADATILSCNKSALQLLAPGEQEATGHHILELNRSLPLREAIQAAQDGKSVDRVIALNGRFLQLFASAVHDENTSLGIIMILLDVTEKQEREKLRREFTANVSHELKTPLTAISGYAELMMNGVAKAQDLPEFSRSIYDESQRLIALVGDLMFLSRLEEGVSPPFEQISLDQLALGVLASLSGKAKSQDISLFHECQAADLMGIPSVLQEMIYNLVDNGIKYNRPGGRVSLSLKATAEEILLSVEDSGFGIPASEQARVFERFYRVDKSHSRAVEGTGLGLAIVKHGAALHEAQLGLHSSPKGSCFTLRFPRSASE